ncbi:MAG TPA: O-antigen ligase family protein [Thermoanaerobaculia bacterium]|nr:O-antigen ligase family protein [Thermoanaerobaculia bacterium]
MSRAAILFELIGTRSVLVLISALIYLCHLLGQGKTAVSELGAFWSLFFLGWAMVKREIRPSFHILWYPLALYGLASTLSAVFAPRRIHSAFEAMLWFKMLIFPGAVILFRALPRLRQYALGAHAIYGIGIAAIGILQFLRGGGLDLERRITGTSTHVMTYAGMLLPLSLLFLILYLHQRKWWFGVTALFTTGALLLTLTRSAWLGWLVALLVVLLFSRPRALLYVVPSIVLLVALLPLPLFSRLVSSFDPDQTSNFDRIRMFSAGVEMIRDYPVLGVGPANVKEVYPLYRAPDAPRFRIPHLHNNVVQIWAERGVLAVIAYLLLLGLFLRECARGWRGPGRGFAEAGVAVATALTVAGLFEFNFGDTEVFYLMLDLFALVVVSLEAAAEEESASAMNSPEVVFPQPAPAGA